MPQEQDASSPRARSRAYPAISLREAVLRCQALYDKDGWSPTLAETAAIHWGFSGLNGGSRPILAALKQFGLAEYVDSGDRLKVKLTDLAKRILRPLHPEERSAAISEAMINPRLYASLHDHFSGWKLPSDATLAARLEREEGIQPKAIKSLVDDIRESVAYLTENAAIVPQTESTTAEASGKEISGWPQDAPSANLPVPQSAVVDGLQTYPMPGGDAFICLPKAMSKDEANRARKWIKQVIIPAIEFAGDLMAEKTDVPSSEHK